MVDTEESNRTNRLKGLLLAYAGQSSEGSLGDPPWSTLLSISPRPNLLSFQGHFFPTSTLAPPYCYVTTTPKISCFNNSNYIFSFLLPLLLESYPRNCWQIQCHEALPLTVYLLRKALLNDPAKGMVTRNRDMLVQNSIWIPPFPLSIAHCPNILCLLWPHTFAIGKGRCQLWQ